MNTAKDTAAELLANALNMKPSEIDESTALGVSPQWDSLAHMRLMLALESRLGRRLDPESIVAISSFKDVLAEVAKAE